MTDQEIAAYEDRQAEEVERFFEKQASICERERQIGMTCIYCESRQYKVDLELPF
jgi:hypothetical protein